MANKAIEEHKEARRDLQDVYRRDIKAAKKAGRRLEETPEYLAANNRVHETEQHVPWYRR